MITIGLWMVVTLSVTTLTIMMGRKYGAGYMVALYAALIVMANVLANKIVLFGPWTVPAGVVVYGISFLITDALNEFYGLSAAKQAVVAGFSSSLLLVLAVQITIAWTPAPFWTEQQALVAILGSTWRIVLGSLLAFVASQSWDIHLFDRIRKHTRGEHLWLRNIVSTVTSQFLDTIIFCTIAFWGTMPNNAVVGIMVGQFVAKCLIATMDTPFLYAMRWVYSTKQLAQTNDGDR